MSESACSSPLRLPIDPCQSFRHRSLLHHRPSTDSPLFPDCGYNLTSLSFILILISFSVLSFISSAHSISILLILSFIFHLTHPLIQSSVRPLISSSTHSPILSPILLFRSSRCLRPPIDSPWSFRRCFPPPVLGPPLSPLGPAVRGRSLASLTSSGSIASLFSFSFKTCPRAQEVVSSV